MEKNKGSTKKTMQVAVPVTLKVCSPSAGEGEA